MNNFYVRLMLLAIILIIIMCIFGLGCTWIVSNIYSGFWFSILIILFTASTLVVSVLIINFFIR